jgi:DNA invertase Pin-like site-specific DNA recombinase
MAKAAGMKIGYARVSTDDQNLDLQRDALKRAGCRKIIEDTVSGGKVKRDGLERALDQLRKGDVLAVWRLDRLGRSLRHLIDLMGDWRGRGSASRARQKPSTQRRRAASWCSTSSRRWRSLSAT